MLGFSYRNGCGMAGMSAVGTTFTSAFAVTPAFSFSHAGAGDDSLFPLYLGRRARLADALPLSVRLARRAQP